MDLVLKGHRYTPGIPKGACRPKRKRKSHLYSWMTHGRPEVDVRRSTVPSKSLSGRTCTTGEGPSDLRRTREDGDRPVPKPPPTLQRLRTVTYYRTVLWVSRGPTPRVSYDDQIQTGVVNPKLKRNTEKTGLPEEGVISQPQNELIQRQRGKRGPRREVGLKTFTNIIPSCSRQT